MIQERQLQIQGIDLRVRELGKAKEILLFLHGWGCDATTMQSVASADITEQYRCVFIDFPGFGKTSAPPEAWGVGDYAAFTADVVHHISADIPVSVIAHSFGARVLLKLLADPKTASLFDKVIITGGAGMKPRRGFSYYYKTTLAKTLKAPFVLLPEPWRGKALAELRKTDIWKSLGSSEYKGLQGTMRQVFVKTVREYLEECLPLISHELLLVWGENDAATPVYQGRRMEQGLSNGHLVILPAAGHYAFLDQPARFQAVIKAYLLT
jgi:pimeloyl-ACP methyl ester carboxylesterase